MSKSKGFKPQELVERPITENMSTGNNIMSCSLPNKLRDKIKECVKKNKDTNIAGKPHNVSQFLRSTTKRFVGIIKKLMEAYPDLFVRDNNADKYAKSFTINYGAENINELNEIIRECTIFYHRSEGIKIGILIYYILEMLDKDFSQDEAKSQKMKLTKVVNSKNTTIEEYKEDTGEMKFVKLNGKIHRILDLDYKTTEGSQSPAD